MTILMRICYNKEKKARKEEVLLKSAKNKTIDLTEEQGDDRSFFEGNGWTIIRPSMDDAAILDAFS